MWCAGDSQRPFFRKRLTERKWKIEGLFGEAKQNHGLRRSRYRGLSMVQIQFYLIAIALNCKRIVDYTSAKLDALKEILIS